MYGFLVGICCISDEYQVDRDSSKDYVVGLINEIATTGSINEFETEMVKRGE